jgi:hypothetical protein
MCFPKANTIRPGSDARGPRREAQEPLQLHQEPLELVHPQHLQQHLQHQQLVKLVLQAQDWPKSAKPEIGHWTRPTLQDATSYGPLPKFQIERNNKLPRIWTRVLN